MSEAARDGKDRRRARIGALTDSQRRTLLAYLCHKVPEAVDAELDQMEADWRRWQAVAQATEAAGE